MPFLFKNKKGNKMNKKVITLGISMLFAVGSYLFSNESKVTTKVMSSTSKSYAVKNADYDINMADDKLGQNKNAPVDYYMLTLSWSPGFCEFNKNQNGGDVPKKLKYQCSNPNKFGWVIHGLWPQSALAKNIDEHPRFCQGDLPPVPEKILEKYMKESPGKALLQAEWEKHGACAFKQPQDYFNMQKVLFNDLKLPEKKLPKKAFFSWMRRHNPQLNGVYMNAYGNEMQICYSKKWKAIDCPRYSSK